jgi:hypothetical protein
MTVRHVVTTAMIVPHAGAIAMTDRFVRHDPSALSVLVLTAQTARLDAMTVMRAPHGAQIDSTAPHAGMIVPTVPTVPSAATPRSTLTSRTSPRSLLRTMSCSNASRLRPHWLSTSKA